MRLEHGDELDKNPGPRVPGTEDGEGRGLGMGAQGTRELLCPDEGVWREHQKQGPRGDKVGSGGPRRLLMSAVEVGYFHVVHYFGCAASLTLLLPSALSSLYFYPLPFPPSFPSFLFSFLLLICNTQRWHPVTCDLLVSGMIKPGEVSTRKVRWLRPEALFCCWLPVWPGWAAVPSCALIFSCKMRWSQ